MMKKCLACDNPAYGPDEFCIDCQPKPAKPSEVFETLRKMQALWTVMHCAVTSAWQYKNSPDVVDTLTNAMRIQPCHRECARRMADWLSAEIGVVEGRQLRITVGDMSEDAVVVKCKWVRAC